MDKIEPELFWIVFTAAMTKDHPTRRHPTKESAIKEAKRLAARHPDYWVYILETVGVARVVPVPPVFTDYEVQGKPEPTGREPMAAGETEQPKIRRLDKPAVMVDLANKGNYESPASPVGSKMTFS